MLRDLEVPAIGPEVLSELSAHLRLPEGFEGDPGEDATLERALRAALGGIEGLTRRAVLERRVLWETHDWRRGEIPIAPISTIESVAVVDAEGASTVADGWRLLAKGPTPRIESPPRIPDGGSAEVVLVAGYGDWAAVPDALRQAVLMWAGHLHETRAAVADGTEAPLGARELLAPYRRVRL